MPELPEVEQFRRYFDSTSLNRTVEGVRVRDSRILRGCSGSSLGRALHGKTFRSSLRRGKYLIAETDGEWQVILHFGMTGSLHFSPSRSPDPTGAVVTFRFADGSSLAYISQRLLGQVRLTRQWETERAIATLGPEPLDPEFSLAAFSIRLRSRNARIKTLLMNQRFVAGIGNLYSDEILFQSQLHPLQKASDLTHLQIKRLYRATRRVLHLAVARNADARRFPRHYLFPHRDIGSLCPRCKSPLASLRMTGRTAIFCPHCQPLLC